MKDLISKNTKAIKNTAKFLIIYFLFISIFLYDNYKDGNYNTNSLVYNLIVSIIIMMCWAVYIFKNSNNKTE